MTTKNKIPTERQDLLQKGSGKMPRPLMSAPQVSQKALLLWNAFAIAAAKHPSSSTFVVPSKRISLCNDCWNRPRSSKRQLVCAAMTIDPNDTEDGENDSADDISVEQKIDILLDTPFFDPYAPSNDDNWFANLVKNDYNSAEALYAGAVVIFGVIVSQELLRMVKCGGLYASFNPGDGKLF